MKAKGWAEGKGGLLHQTGKKKRETGAKSKEGAPGRLKFSGAWSGEERIGGERKT